MPDKTLINDRLSTTDVCICNKINVISISTVYKTELQIRFLWVIQILDNVIGVCVGVWGRDGETIWQKQFIIR